MRRRRLILVVACIGLGGGPAGAQPRTTGDNAGLPDAIGFLAHEKSAAEQYAAVLGTVSRSNTAVYLHGLQLYADAKAEFDSLIAELKFDLTSGHDPARSARFADALQGAAEKRVAFTTFISHEVIDKAQGARPGLPVVIEAVPALLKAITDSGIAIWKGFRDAGKERRDAILADLDELKWRSFAEVTRS